VLGCKAVQISAVFLCQNLGVILLPIIQGIFILIAIGGTIIAAIFLFSLGNITFNTGDAFPTVALTTGVIIMIAFCVFGGLWITFYFHGCNRFMLSSAVSIWYFNSPLMGD